MSPASRTALRSALERLQDGTPIRRNGALTVSGPAAEAGVSRAIASLATQVLSDLSKLRHQLEGRAPSNHDDTTGP